MKHLSVKETTRQMQVKLHRYRRDGSTHNEHHSVEWWIKSNLDRGGIEAKLSKLQALMTIVGEQWLLANPSRVGDVADAIDCDGLGHEIVSDVDAPEAWRVHEKPPNEKWVEVLDGDKVVEAMAFFGRDGTRPHWKLRDGSACHPSMFSRWREIR